MSRKRNINDYMKRGRDINTEYDVEMTETEKNNDDEGKKKTDKCNTDKRRGKERKRKKNPKSSEEKREIQELFWRRDEKARDRR